MVQTIPSLNCLSVKAPLAAEHQELGAEAVRDFRVEKEDKTAVQVLCKKEIGDICGMKGRIGRKLSSCSHHFCSRGSLDNLLSKLVVLAKPVVHKDYAYHLTQCYVLRSCLTK